MESAKSRVRRRTRRAASCEASTAYVCARVLLPKERRKGKGETGEVKEEESEE